MEAVEELNRCLDDLEEKYNVLEREIEKMLDQFKQILSS